MKNKSQLERLRLFLQSNENILIINMVNNEIEVFYLYLIEYFSFSLGINLSFKEDVNNNFFYDNSLFAEEKIDIYRTTVSKNNSKILQNKHKKILITDYKNYKKINLVNNSINGYQFETDMSIFLNDILNIKNKDLYFFCKNNPALFGSELSKFQVNNINYIPDEHINEPTSNIIEIRKSIFELKRNNQNIKLLYKKIVDEARFKKFNFLTYYSKNYIARDYYKIF